MTLTDESAAALPTRQFAVSLDGLNQARERVKAHARWTPIFTSRLLSDLTGFDVVLKAENLQRTGSYKIRGPLNKLALLSAEQKAAGVVCSSAGNHAQGVALAARIYGIRAVVCMAERATPSKVAATRGYGADVRLEGAIWEDSDRLARRLVEDEGLTYIHPFDDLELIAGQASVGLEIADDVPDADAVVVPIGGGGLISGVSLAIKQRLPMATVIGVESAAAPAMQRSLEAGSLVTLDGVDDCAVDGLRVKRVGENNFRVAQQCVDRVVTVEEGAIRDAVLWTMNHAKQVVEGAAAGPVAALLANATGLPPGSRVVCVLSGGNLNLDLFMRGGIN